MVLFLKIIPDILAKPIDIGLKSLTQILFTFEL